MLELAINGTSVDVQWEDNASVAELVELCADEPLELSLSRYGGFEQVGPLGTGIESDDREMTTKAGDIVLYSSNQIVIFYGSNTWDYTRLGHVANLSSDELTSLLDAEGVTATLSVA